MTNKTNTLNSDPYKGTRDFYPYNSIINSSDGISFKHHQVYLFDKIKQTLIQNGFEEYSSSLIEDKVAFSVKSGDDLASNQLYYFTDKGQREIALRPELTLSIARMVANKYQNLRLPLRWFSIDNCFRYERPQKGRLREFWQVEVDIIGQKAGPVDFEIMRLIIEIFKNLQATSNMYKIMYNHRGVLEDWIVLNNWQEEKLAIFKILDDWYKLSELERKNTLASIVSSNDIDIITNTANQTGEDYQNYLKLAHKYPEIELITTLIPKLYPDVNCQLCPAIIRGQAYYTGLIFEAFDQNPNNNRSLFGGGRFDDLLDLYGKKAPAVGFAPGDVSLHEFMKGWNLYPKEILATKIGFIPKSQNDLENIYTELVPNLITEQNSFEIDYDYSRSVNKRYETLQKRGCSKIIEL
jgi:histidyl-tRNA synthetase